MRGRKPKPSWLKVISGNPGERRLNDLEPMPEGDLLEPPDWMSESQKEGWRYVMASAPQGLLKRLDRSILTNFVCAEDQHRDATMMIAKYGSVIKSKPSGRAVQSPYVMVQHKAALLMLKAASELGFSPSSRSRVKVHGTSPSRGNEFDGLQELGDD